MKKAIFILFVLLGPLLCRGKTIYVDANARGANDGTSWENAYFYLQDALMFAVGDDEIHVAQGVYLPDDFVLSDRPSRGREETFQLINGVALKGGYAGFGQPDPNARDIELYETILSGDLSGNDVDIDDLEELANEPTRAENSYHVVVGSGTDATAVLDGLTITGGNANVWTSHCEGGGIYNDNGSPTIANCTLTGNSVKHAGGGMANYRESSPTLTNCVFAGNSALPSYSGEGGGIFNFWYSNPTLINCTFRRNVSSSGGGMCNDASCSPVLIACAFAGNWAVGGGGIQNYRSSPTLTKCIFSGNRASKDGGAIHNHTRSDPTVIQCTFAANSAPNGSAIACDSWQQRAPCRLQVTNSILWDNGDEIWNNDGSTISIRHSNVRGGWVGAGNIDADPCFAETGYWDTSGTPGDANDDLWADGDYHLRSQAGRYDPNSRSWVVDEVTSLCIDAGDPMAPIMYEPFPNGGVINMGAYGGTAEASKSYFDGPVCETIVAGDVNGDCEVNFLDFRLMALHWMEDHHP